MQIPAPKFPGRLRSRMKYKARMELTMNFEDAYRAKRLAQWKARRTEQRVIDSLKRRGIGSAQPIRPIFPYVQYIVRPGARTINKRGHVDTTSETFRMARKRTKHLKHRMAKDEEAVQVLYNAPDLVAQSLFDLGTTASNGDAHANFLNESVHELWKSLPYFQWLQRCEDPPVPQYHNFEQQIGWDWSKILGSFANALDMHRNDHQETKDREISACAKFSEFAEGIGLTFGHGDASPELMEGVQHDRPEISHDHEAMDVVKVPEEDAEMEDILPDTHHSYSGSWIIDLFPPLKDTTMPDAVAPTASSQERATQPQPESTGCPNPARNSTKLDSNRLQNAADGPRMPAVPGLRTIWERKKAEAAATRSTVKTQAAAIQDASFRQRNTPSAVPEEDEKDPKSDEENEDASDEYED